MDLSCFPSLPVQDSVSLLQPSYNEVAECFAQADVMYNLLVHVPNECV